EDLRDVRAQLACGRVDDLILFLNADRQRRGLHAFLQELSPQRSLRRQKGFVSLISLFRATRTLISLQRQKSAQWSRRRPSHSRAPQWKFASGSRPWSLQSRQTDWCPTCVRSTVGALLRNSEILHEADSLALAQCTARQGLFARPSPMSMNP